MIHEQLATGKENAITGQELAERNGMSLRRVAVQVEKERREGYPICATTGNKTQGYFLPETVEELNEYCEILKKRAVELLKTRKALITLIRQLNE